MSTAESRPLSVVVATRNRPDMLRDCLAALRAARRKDDEIIVVDSASTPPLPRSGDDVNLLRCDHKGASAARNLGWRSARHEIVAFVDDDVRVARDWTAHIAASFEDASCAFVTGRLVPDVDCERPVTVADFANPFVIDGTSRGTIGASANCAIRRDALDQLGGFDERLGPGTWFAAAEDLDLFDRLLAAGLIGRHEPGASAVHLQWRRSRHALLLLEWHYGKGMGARLALERRRNRSRARALRREALVAKGVREIGQTLRERYEFGALAAAVRTAGTLYGGAVGRVRLR